jgi:hypothetical protein
MKKKLGQLKNRFFCHLVLRENFADVPAGHGGRPPAISGLLAKFLDRILDLGPML